MNYTIKIFASNPYSYISRDNPSGLNCLVAVRDEQGRKVGVSESCVGSIQIQNAKLWWPYLSSPENEKPGYLYTLEIHLTSGSETFHGDVYRQKFGIRTAEVVNDTFLINTKPFYFRGFGRHEDYNVCHCTIFHSPFRSL